MDAPHIPGARDVDPNHPHELPAHHQKTETSSATTAVPVMATAPATLAKKPRTWLQESIAYLPELFVSNWVLVGLHVSAILLFNNLIDNIGKAGSSIWDTFSYGSTIAAISSVLVALPVWYILWRRTVGTEGKYPEIIRLKWRRAFIGIFTVILMLTVLGILTAIVYEVLSKLAVTGIETGESSQPWRTYVKEVFALVLFAWTLRSQLKRYVGGAK